MASVLFSFSFFMLTMSARSEVAMVEVVVKVVSARGLCGLSMRAGGAEGLARGKELSGGFALSLRRAGGGERGESGAFT
jgi:hypothetical protein